MTPQREEAERLLRLAERDYHVFEILAATGEQAHAAAGFHAQQAIEKALKALMCLHDIEIPRSHDLESLLKRLGGTGPLPPVSTAQLRPLTPYAVDFRYDDEPAYLLSEDEMRTLISPVIEFVASELASPADEGDSDQ